MIEVKKCVWLLRFPNEVTISRLFRPRFWNRSLSPWFLSLRPANKILVQGTVFTPVCQSFCSRGKGWCLPHCMLGYTPRQTLPTDTMGYGQQAGGTHPTGMHTCYTLF